MNNKTFSDNLKEKRIAAGYTQSEISELLFLSRTSYNHFETGKRLPTLRTLVDVSVLLNISPMELLSPLLEEAIENNPTQTKPSWKNEYLTQQKDIQFISDYNNLNESQQHSINNLLRMLNSNQSESIR